MDTKRLILFVIFTFSTFYLWQQWQQSQHPKPETTASAGAKPASAASVSEALALKSLGRVQVETDVIKAEIDLLGGDLRKTVLKNYTQIKNSEAMLLLQDSGEHVYVAQSGLLGSDLPTHNSVFTLKSPAAQTLAAGQNTLDVVLEHRTASGLLVTKTYRFTRGSYLVNLKQDIRNSTAQAVDVQAYYRLLRDGNPPPEQSSMVHAFTGPSYSSSESKFSKVDFSDLDKGKALEHPKPQDGWLAMIQHYFVSAWLFNQPQGPSLCANNSCVLEFKALKEGVKDLQGHAFAPAYSAGVIQTVGKLPPNSSRSLNIHLYTGPQAQAEFDKPEILALAPELKRTRDYGHLWLVAEPLFSVLKFFYQYTANWGWAIVLLTLSIKLAFFKLSASSYRSMAQMKALAPKLEEMKQRYGEDRMKFQQATMELYKEEKVNPLGGCLPMLVQIPVFFSLYQVLAESVELRHAPWVLWIHDLSALDPYYILPAIMAVTMVIQSFMSPPPADPLQAKMMRIMPIAFSVMFFFFPAGLVLYWVVNNLLSMAQQWYITRRLEQQSKLAK